MCFDVEITIPYPSSSISLLRITVAPIRSSPRFQIFNRWREIGGRKEEREKREGGRYFSHSRRFERRGSWKIEAASSNFKRFRVISDGVIKIYCVGTKRQCRGVARFGFSFSGERRSIYIRVADAHGSKIFANSARFSAFAIHKNRKLITFALIEFLFARAKSPFRSISRTTTPQHPPI